jgi:hypothetical protein
MHRHQPKAPFSAFSAFSAFSLEAAKIEQNSDWDNFPGAGIVKI